MQVNITYRDTSRISLRVTSTGRVNISAPYGTPKQTIADFVRQHESWLLDALVKVREARDKKDAFFGRLPLRTAAERRDAAARMDAILLPMVEKYARRMQVVPSSITYKPLVSQWGNCQPRTGRITFSIYLLLLPEWCIEHIVVHELAHMLVPNHGPEFHAVMDRFFPRWKEARRTTRHISNMDDDER